MITTDIVWSAKYVDDDYSAIDEQTTILCGTWADCDGNGEAAVNHCLEDYFRIDEEWIEHFGDDTSGYLLVTVTSPASIAGTYRVRLDRVVKASARGVSA